jgi:hypothetical protein
MASINYTEPMFHLERVDDVFLRKRSVIKLEGSFYSFLQNSSTVSVTGNNKGKLRAINHLMAKTLMQTEEEVLFIDSEKQFSITKLSELCANFIASENASEVVEEKLKKLRIMRMFMSSNGKETNDELLIAAIKNFLEVNNKVSLVVIDSLGYFYYTQDQISEKKYLENCAGQLKELSKKCGVSVVFTIPNFIEMSSKHINKSHSIEISEERNEDIVVMRLKATGDEEEEGKIFVLELNARNIVEKEEHDLYR